jgi:hypothetical protein
MRHRHTSEWGGQADPSRLKCEQTNHFNRLRVNWVLVRQRRMLHLILQRCYPLPRFGTGTTDGRLEPRHSSAAPLCDPVPSSTTRWRRRSGRCRGIGRLAPNHAGSLTHQVNLHPITRAAVCHIRDDSNRSVAMNKFRKHRGERYQWWQITRWGSVAGGATCTRWGSVARLRSGTDAPTARQNAQLSKSQLGPLANLLHRSEPTPLEQHITGGEHTRTVTVPG